MLTHDTLKAEDWLSKICAFCSPVGIQYLNFRGGLEMELTRF